MTKTTPHRLLRPDVQGKGVNRYGRYHDLPAIYRENEKRLKELGISRTQFQDICVTYNETLIDRFIERGFTYMKWVGKFEFRKSYLHPILKEDLIKRLKQFNCLFNEKYFFMAKVFYAFNLPVKKYLKLIWKKDSRLKFNELYKNPKFDCLEVQTKGTLK